MGSTGSDVLALQEFLNASSTTMIAQTGPGSPGNETDRFGALTRNAVERFQELHASEILKPNRMEKGTGIIGALSRAVLNGLCSSAVPVASTSSATSSDDVDQLVVASDKQPAATLALAGAGGVPFTSFVLTAGSKDVTVKSVSAERAGLAEDGAFDSVSLNDEESEIGDDQHFDANHRVFFNEPFTIPAHSSKTITIDGNMTTDETNFAQQMPVIQVDSIDATSPVIAQLPLRGTAQIINDNLAIGGASAALSSFDPGVSSTRYIGDKNVRFAGIRLTANAQEDLSLHAITWTQDGTISDSDVSDVTTVINGNPYATEVDGHEFTSNFSPAIVIPRGQTIDIYIEGNLATTGAGRTVKFDINGSDDIDLTGNTYGYGVGVTASGNTATAGNSVFLTSDGTPNGESLTPFFAASTVTIQGGTAVSIQNAN